MNDPSVAELLVTKTIEQYDVIKDLYSELIKLQGPYNFYHQHFNYVQSNLDSLRLPDEFMDTYRNIRVQVEDLVYQVKARENRAQVFLKMAQNTIPSDTVHSKISPSIIDSKTVKEAWILAKRSF